MRRIYLETSVVSYLAARPSRDMVIAAHQQLTRDWWDRRFEFELFVADPVLEEASRGDLEAAQRRLAFLEGIPVLTAHPDALGLARSFLAEAALPSNAAIDALHVALAAVHGMDFLLTWNCTHIANARIRSS
jgi:predicted nucleic acid-binding protein